MAPTGAVAGCPVPRGRSGHGATPAPVPARESAVSEQQGGNQTQPEQDSDRSQRGDQPFIRGSEGPRVKRTLHPALPDERVGDAQRAEPRERDAQRQVRPVVLIGQLGNQLARAEADGERRQPGAPPGEEGPLVGQPGAA